MKNALILTGVWLGILVAAYGIVFWDQGIDRPLPISLLEEQAQVAGENYVHPDGLFSASLPVGWQLKDAASIAWMTDPNETIDGWIIASDAAGLDEALSDAFMQIGLEEDYTLVASVSFPIEGWSGAEVQATYRSDSTADVVTIKAQRPADWTILLVARGPGKALDALAENLEWIWTELSIPADELLLL